MLRVFCLMVLLTITTVLNFIMSKQENYSPSSPYNMMVVRADLFQ